MRALVAEFLHHFPQYTLRDLTDGTLQLHELLWLHAGMIDCTSPETTEPTEDQVARQIKDTAVQAHEREKARRDPRRGSW